MCIPETVTSYTTTTSPLLLILQVCRELSGPEQEILMILIKEEIQNRYDVYTHPETNERQFEPMAEPAIEEHHGTKDDYVKLLTKRVLFNSDVEFMPVL